MAMSSGWSDLAKRYSTDKEPQVPWKIITSMTLNYLRLVRVYCIAFDKDGFFLDVIFLFKFRHPRLFIPYAEIQFIKVYTRFLHGQSYEFKFPKIPTISSIRMELYQQDGEEMQSHIT